MLLLILLFVAAASEARTLHVPAEYSTIQTALDSVQNNDTVLVALGTYAEALRAPARTFVVWGDVPSDSADIPRPTVDPSTLPGSDTLCCLTIPYGARPTIRNFRFYNGPQMFPRLRIGGIACYAQSLAMSYCVLDSTYMGIGTDLSNRRIIILDNCKFRHNFMWCVRASGGGRLCATRCAFDGVSGMAELVAGGDSSIVSECTFRSDSALGLLDLYGWGIVLDRTTFAHARGVWLPVLVDGNNIGQGSGEVTSNVFSDLQVGEAALWLSSACSDSVTVRNNIFAGNRGGFGQCDGAIEIACLNGNTGVAMGIIEDNVFEVFSDAWLTHGEAVTADASATLRRNTFRNMNSNTVPAVWSADGRSVLTENNFIATRLGLCKYLPGGDSLDARNNYWGDPSGPYDPVLNPLGRGAEIICNHEVQISPWLDSAYVPSKAHSPFILNPSSLILYCFPNPFNPVTQIRYDIPKSGMVTLKVYDLLGREVTLLIDKRLDVGSYSAEWIAENYPSGVYFAVLQAGDKRMVQKMLLMK